MTAQEDKIPVSASDAICHAGADCMLFALQPENFPAFHSWLMKHSDRIRPDYTPEMMREDLQTIYDVLVERYLP